MVKTITYTYSLPYLVICNYCKQNMHEINNYCEKSYYNQLLILDDIIFLCKFNFICPCIVIHVYVIFENSLAPNGFNTFRWVDKSPHFVDIHIIHLKFHDSNPFISLYNVFLYHFEYF